MATLEEVKQYVISTHATDTKEQLQYIHDATERQLSSCLPEHKLVLEGWIVALDELLQR